MHDRVLSDSFTDYGLITYAIRDDDGFSIRDGCIVVECSEKLESS